MSKMNAKKAAKLDMDDRAKILQYFSRPVGGAGDIAGELISTQNYLKTHVIFIRNRILLSFYLFANFSPIRCCTKCKNRRDVWQMLDNTRASTSTAYHHHRSSTCRHRQIIHVEIHVHEMGLS